jgi:hypothetical protein
MVCFNNYDHEETIWGPEDWDFLLDDLSERLTPNGRIVFSFNAQLDGRFYSEEIDGNMRIFYLLFSLQFLLPKRNAFDKLTTCRASNNVPEYFAVFTGGWRSFKSCCLFSDNQEKEIQSSLLR